MTTDGALSQLDLGHFVNGHYAFPSTRFGRIQSAEGQAIPLQLHMLICVNENLSFTAEEFGKKKKTAQGLP